MLSPEAWEWRVLWGVQFGTRSFLLMRCDFTDFICRINPWDQVMLFHLGALNINLCNYMEVVLCKTPEWETLRGYCFPKLNLLLADSPSLPSSSSFRLKLHNQVSSCCLSHTLKYAHTRAHAHTFKMQMCNVQKYEHVWPRRKVHNAANPHARLL